MHIYLGDSDAVGEAKQHEAIRAPWGSALSHQGKGFQVQPLMPPVQAWLQLADAQLPPGLCASTQDVQKLSLFRPTRLAELEVQQLAATQPPAADELALQSCERSSCLHIGLQG